MDKLERNKKRLRREIKDLTDWLHRLSRKDRVWHNVHAILNQTVDELAALGESTDEKRLEWIQPKTSDRNALEEGQAKNEHLERE